MIIKISFIITIFWHNEKLYTFHLMTVEMLKISHKKEQTTTGKTSLDNTPIKDTAKETKGLMPAFPRFETNPKIDQIGHINCPWVKRTRIKWSSACQKQEGQEVFIVRHSPILKHLLSTCQRLSHSKKPLVE